MGVSTKVFVNFKDFSQANMHIVKDFIDYVRILGYTNKTNFLGKGYLDDNFNLHLDKWSMFTRFPFTTEEGNTLLTKRTTSRGEHLIGVYWSKTANAFVAQISKNKGGREHLGCFKTELEAFNAYKQAKESFVKEQANKWKLQIDERAYKALMNYQVEITD